MIVENPYTQPHYLTAYFPVRPKVIDKDRRENGDYYAKPTQYWFVNCEPEDNLVFEVLEYAPTCIVMKADEMDVDADRKAKRSLMHPQYARRFIKQYITEEE